MSVTIPEERYYELLQAEYDLRQAADHLRVLNELRRLAARAIHSLSDDALAALRDKLSELNSAPAIEPGRSLTLRTSLTVVQDVLGLPINEKLVRDRIPDLIRGTESTAVSYPAAPETVEARLKAKLAEETLEFVAQSEPSLLLLELADIAEVVEAILRHIGATEEDLQQVVEQKRNTHGAFTQHHVLVDMDSLPFLD